MEGMIHSTKFPEISVQNSMDQFGPTGKVLNKTSPPFEVDHFSWSDRLEFWLNGLCPELTHQTLLFKKKTSDKS